MSSNVKKAIVLVLLCIAIAVIPLMIIKNSEFGGSDDAASQAISQLTGKEYVPWAAPIYEPPGGETESLLFCLQAALGAGIFGYGIGVLKERSKRAKE